MHPPLIRDHRHHHSIRRYPPLHLLKILHRKVIFKVVVLIGINERNIPSKVTEGYPFTGMDALDKKEFMSSKRSLLYVAITRAGQLVYMVVYGEPCGLVESIIED